MTFSHPVTFSHPQIRNGQTLLAFVSLVFVLGVIPAAVVGTFVFLFSVYFPDKLIPPKCDYLQVLLDDTSPQSSPTLAGAEADNYERENQKLVPRRCEVCCLLIGFISLS
jgi:hypothetical protein